MFLEPQGPLGEVFPQGTDGEVLLASDKGLYGAADVECFHDLIGARFSYVYLADRRSMCHKYIRLTGHSQAADLKQHRSTAHCVLCADNTTAMGNT